MQEAVETKVASHLHPEGSFDLADHPVPNGREEIWRFTPLKRLRGLHDGSFTGGGTSTVEVDAPEGVTVEGRSRRPAARHRVHPERPRVRPGLGVLRAGPGRHRPGRHRARRRARHRHGRGRRRRVRPPVRRGRHPRKATLVLHHAGRPPVRTTPRSWSATAPRSPWSACRTGTTTPSTSRTSTPRSVATRRTSRASSPSAATSCGSTPPSTTPGPAARPSCSACTSPTPASTSSTGCSSTTTRRRRAATSTTRARCRARARTRCGSATC